MSLTPGFKALKGAQEFVRSFAPGVAESVRESSDSFEQMSDADKNGLLYKFGTHFFPIFGKVTERSMKLIGKEQFVDSAYKNTIISVEEFNELKNNGLAIAPKIVKDM